MLQKLFGNEICDNRVVRRIFFEKALFVKIFPSSYLVPKKLAVCLQIGNNESCGNTFYDVFFFTQHIFGIISVVIEPLQNLAWNCKYYLFSKIDKFLKKSQFCF